MMFRNAHLAVLALAWVVRQGPFGGLARIVCTGLCRSQVPLSGWFGVACFEVSRGITHPLRLCAGRHDAWRLRLPSRVRRGHVPNVKFPARQPRCSARVAQREHLLAFHSTDLCCIDINPAVVAGWLSCGGCIVQPGGHRGLHVPCVRV